MSSGLPVRVIRSKRGWMLSCSWRGLAGAVAVNVAVTRAV